ncbi:MAG: PAS domain S-box protein [Anaerolineae bacterium]|jgi:PAS domain S-box-containing protein|nr:PAS domain S-box protein [Anaerolineae bacterium]
MSSQAEVQVLVASTSLWWLLGGIALLAVLGLWRLHIRSMQQRNREMEAIIAARTAELRLFSHAVEQSAASIVITDLQGDIQFVNPAFSAITGYTVTEVLRQNPRLLQSGLTPPETYAALWKALKRGEDWSGEFTNKRKDGSLFYERATISPVKNEAGAITYYLAIKEDITAQKEAEIALRESERLLQLIFENANIGIGLLNLEGHFTRVNPRMCALFGYSDEEILAIPFNTLIHPAYREASPLFVQHLRAEKLHRTTYEQQYYHQDGHLIWGLTSSTLVRDAQDAPLYYVVHVQDITNEKQSETALRESEERFAAVLNSLQAAIYVADMESHELLFVNHQLCRDFGAIEGQHCWQVLHAGQARPCESCINPQLLTPTGEAAPPLIREYQDPQNGKWYQIHNEAIHWIDGRWVQLNVTTDITDLKRAEQRLLAQQRQLVTLEERERIGRELHDDLGQMLSYINVQTQAVQTLLAQDKTAPAKEALKQLTQAAQAAHSDLRRYILGIRGEPTPGTPTAPITFLEALQHYLDELRHNYAFSVEFNLPEEDLTYALTPEVEGQLLRIIQEALANARKHSGIMEARLSFSLNPEQVQALVEDHGKGFEPVTANGVARQPASPDNPHFGLGIMAERAAQVGGSVRVHSRLGQGTRVVILMPRALRPQATSATVKPGLRVLLADDHHLFVAGLRTLLAARGVQVVGIAHNGLEAQAQARALAPEVILMDVNMPICDGIEATRHIKAEFPDVKIVMLTMAADDDTLFSALQAGASGYLLKSLQGDEFHRLLQDLARGEAVLSPGLAQRVLNAFTQPSAAPAEEAPSPIPELTQQQIIILDLVAQGLTYKEAGTQLHLTERTIRYHMGQILQRLQLENKRAAIAYARRQGLGSGE